MFVRELAGPPGAPALVLLHGWTASADLNFFTAYRALGGRFRVVAFDHRGHGSGLRSWRPFRLEDCADDVISVADALGIDRFTAVGYSMGGAVAQLSWRRHPERVAGLVLCATASSFHSGARQDRLPFLGLTGLATLARLTPGQIRTRLTHQLYLQRKTSQWEPWAIEQAMRHDWRMVFEAGSAIGRFSSQEWLDKIDVPAAAVVTLRDTVVPAGRQLKMFDVLRGGASPRAAAWRIDGGHDAIVTHADRFVPTLVEATEYVTSSL